MPRKINSSLRGQPCASSTTFSESYHYPGMDMCSPCEDNSEAGESLDAPECKSTGSGNTDNDNICLGPDHSNNSMSCSNNNVSNNTNNNGDNNNNTNNHNNDHGDGDGDDDEDEDGGDNENLCLGLDHSHSSMSCSNNNGSSNTNNNGDNNNNNNHNHNNNNEDDDDEDCNDDNDVEMGNYEENDSEQDLVCQFSRSFPPGKSFPDKDSLVTQTRALAAKLGFMTTINGRAIMCNRNESKYEYKNKNTDDNASNKRFRSTTNFLKCGCNFKIAFGYKISPFHMPGTICDTTQAERFRTTPELKEVIVLPSSKYVHTNGCNPSYEQYHIQAKAAGKLLSKESEKMDDMLTILELSDWQISNNALRGHLKLVNPARSYITADELRNFRLWAKKQSLNRQSGSKKTVLTDKDLKEMFNDVIAKPNSNIAVEQAEELYRNLIRDVMQSNNNLWKVEKYLESIKQVDECFDYYIARDQQTGSPTMVIWQTGTMRADFELYGAGLHLDFMKRKMNSYNWPYMSIVVMDANGSPRVAAEGIACTERHEAYVAGVNAALDMTPGRKREDIFVLFADKILGPDILLPGNLNLPNAHFVWDCHHLLTDIWPKDFGGSWSGNLSSGMSSLLFAESESAFQEAAGNLELVHRGNTNVVNTIHKWSSLKEHYAKYILDDTPGTLGKISNNPAEQNHSSIVAHLGGALYEEPGSEIKKLLVRQRNLETQRQQQKSKYKYMMPAEIQNDPIINSDPELKKVKHTLDRKSFHMWRDEYFLSDKYCVEIDRDHNCRIFTHKEHPNSPRIVSASERCNCSIRKQYFIQCRHEICEAGGKFILGLIDRRHIFYATLHTQVKRNSTIDGILSQSSHVGRSDCSGDNEIDNHIPPLYDIEHHDLLTEVGESHMGFELSASASKKPSNITYKVLKGVLDDFAQTCISQGIGNEAYGCAVQLLNVARTGGDLVEGNLEEIIHGYQNMFSSTQTKNVTFTLSQGSALHHEECDVQVPNLPITKIGSRACETRMKPASERPIKGNNTPRGCGFCEKVGHKITKCSELSDFGVRLTNGAKSKSPDQYKQLSSYLNAVITNSSFDQFATWPTDNDSPMVEGVPKTVQHLVIHGFFSYTPTNSHPQIVVAVQFLLQGGIPLAAYSFVPMTVPELIKVLYANFLANKKCVIVHNVLYPCIGSMS